MLDYGWVSGGETGGQESDSHHVYDHYGVQSYSEAVNYYGIPEIQYGAVSGAPNPLQYHGNPTANFQGFYDGAVAPPYQNPSMLSIEPSIPMGYMVVPKPEPAVGGFEFHSRLGLNLGGRTYFASAEDDFVSRLYRRSRLFDSGVVNVPRCQAESCNADLGHAKHYHRRHKVCEFHSKAATVVAGGLTQRFCQQCSRFHVLSEFDNGKRSCRKRLADHNRRRRKSQRANEETISKSQMENISDANSPSENMSRSPPESGQNSSTFTAATDHLQHRSYGGGYHTSSTASTSSLFYSND